MWQDHEVSWVPNVRGLDFIEWTQPSADGRRLARVASLRAKGGCAHVH